MAFVQALPVQRRNDARSSGGVPIPPGFRGVVVRIDCPATGEQAPFTNPAQQLVGYVDLSYDGGVTWPDHTPGGPWEGHPDWDGTTGGWNKDGSAGPSVVVMFAPTRYPTHARAGYEVQSGPISFGVSYELQAA